jgi:hypothetical protein
MTKIGTDTPTDVEDCRPEIVRVDSGGISIGIRRERVILLYAEMKLA